jgi:hypothetical protein
MENAEISLFDDTDLDVEANKTSVDRTAIIKKVRKN